jgi:hypothetical protein
MIECATMHLIYFSFVQIFFFSNISSIFHLYRKCSSTIRYDVYRPNNVSLIPISNHSIHKIYLSRRPLLYLLSKREPSDISIYIYINVYVFIITSDIFSSFS